MLACTSVEEFGRAGGTAYYAGARFIRWRVDPHLRGYRVWGQATVDDARELVAAFEAEARHGRLGRQGSLGDYRELRGVEPAAFDILLRHVLAQPRHASPAREAVVRPAGIVGAIVAGFFDVALREAGVFQSAREALRWLGHPEAETVLGTMPWGSPPPEVSTPVGRRLQLFFAEHGRASSVAEAAAFLRMSSRTLQHHLQSAGTHFRAERDRGLLLRAQRALADSDLPLGRVASDLGFRSPQRFSDWFRRLVGQPPSRWRHARRRGGARP
jgi:AraC-like DNA-binding protein